MNLLARLSYGFPSGLRKTLRRQVKALNSERRLAREIDEFAHAGARGPLPDFLIIGAPKCGTSWLSHVLRRQPGVFVVPDEIEYFSSRVDRPLDWYLAQFRNLAAENDVTLGPDAAPLLGEKSASYCGMPARRIQLVHRLLPDARLILMIRDPVTRHWSHAKRFFSKKKAQDRGYHSLDSREQLNRFFIGTQRFSEFSRIVERWTDVYPPEQILIVAQETAFADPASTLARVARHIEASGSVDPSLSEGLRTDKNQGPAIPMPEDVRLYLEHMFAGEAARLEQVLRARYPAQVVREIGFDIEPRRVA